MLPLTPQMAFKTLGNNYNEGPASNPRIFYCRKDYFDPSTIYFHVVIISLFSTFSAFFSGLLKEGQKSYRAKRYIGTCMKG